MEVEDVGRSRNCREIVLVGVCESLSKRCIKCMCIEERRFHDDAAQEKPKRSRSLSVNAKRKEETNDSRKKGK